MMTYARMAALASLSAVSLALAGCGSGGDNAEPAETSPAPAATASIGTGMGPTPVYYDCDPELSLSVVYDQSAPGGGAMVTLDGTQYAMDRVESASGAKYDILPGRTAGKTLIWWNQGEEGMLMEGTRGDAASEETIATCISIIAASAAG